MTEKITNFGFRTVAESAKEGLVREVFSTVATRYDLMNDLMSAGIHRIWKDAMVEWLNPRPGWHCLDVAGGTGDIAFRIEEMVRSRGAPAAIRICDINLAMLGEGMRRAKANESRALHWVCANAEMLPFPDFSFDSYTIAFGIRNVTHIERALSEARRVLKHGGRFLCLEFSRLQVPGLDRLYEAYSFKLLPKIGALVAGQEGPYRYLAESIRRFPAQEEFARMIAAAGLGQVKVRNLSGGIAAMHSAWRI